MSEIKSFANKYELIEAAAQRVTELAANAIETTGIFSIALAGGSTPRGLYELLALPRFAQQIDWTRVHVFWGDERCVPPDHNDSNYRMVRETLLDHVPIPTSNVHRMRGELLPKDAAASYEQELGAHFGESPSDRNSTTRFDLVLLGMGDDGHTASIFPYSPAINEQTRLVVASYVEKLSSWRITLTPTSINAAANIVFLVTGIEKTARLQQVLSGPYQPQVLPAQSIQPTNGTLQWLVDTAALPGEVR